METAILVNKSSDFFQRFLCFSFSLLCESFYQEESFVDLFLSVNKIIYRFKQGYKWSVQNKKEKERK